ncbi:membrane protein containing Cysteine, histidine-dependent amidohydrolase/peptidase domain protein [Candidatus Magnetobacterium bavaricum]|uniref:Membrane protein containing Cysteine, histidine-dependent amidohydrolase/peptidase domain protein n=1 Tax=Candidatus Magnetobacterium bavaricum TaxID=29290 RepID=A0A0F3GUK0_9BACT|nr:membrane protein containing Cysteine, histidine-dependent amidohydrolase/peptidase domain protein [Candidatus Magnetobacterium bavaricum]
MKGRISKVVVVVAMLVVVFAVQLYAEDTYKAPSVTYSYSNGVFGIMVLGVNYGTVSDFLLDDVSIGETLAQMATQGQLVVYQYSDWFQLAIYATEEALTEFAGQNFQIVLTEGTVLSKTLPEVSDLLYASDDSSTKAATKCCWCTQYVYKKKDLSGSYKHAKTWNDGFLQSTGYKDAKNKPESDQIVVFENRSDYGHVGIIKKVKSKGDNWVLTVTGANNDGSVKGDKAGNPISCKKASPDNKTGCNNVSDKTYTVSKKDTNVSYWKKLKN